MVSLLSLLFWHDTLWWLFSFSIFYNSHHPSPRVKTSLLKLSISKLGLVQMMNTRTIYIYSYTIQYCNIREFFLNLPTECKGGCIHTEIMDVHWDSSEWEGPDLDLAGLRLRYTDTDKTNEGVWVLGGPQPKCLTWNLSFWKPQFYCSR